MKGIHLEHITRRITHPGGTRRGIEKLISTKEGMLEMSGTIDEILADYKVITRGLAKTIDNRLVDKENIHTVLAMLLMSSADMFLEYLNNGGDGISEVLIEEME